MMVTAFVSPVSKYSNSTSAPLNLFELARVYQSRWRIEPDGRAVVGNPQFSLILRPDGRRVTLMGIEVWLQQALPSAAHRAGWLHRADVERLIDPILRPAAHLGGLRAATVVLDPGHGGRDGGAVGFGNILEKDLALEMARAVRTRLAVAGLKVHLTRETDVLVALDERPRIAAARGADLFVSIHFNAAEPGSHGIETYILSKAGAPSTHTVDQRLSPRYRPLNANHHDAANAVLGFHLQRQLVRRTGAQDRGLRHARFAVLREAPCPAALVECGFLTDPEEARRLADPAYRERIAEGLARGILEYARIIQRTRTLNLAP